jgi:hypothetical protein
MTSRNGKIAARYLIVYFVFGVLITSLSNGKAVNYIAILFYSVPITWLSLKVFKLKE